MMMNAVELSREQIREEVRAIREAAGKIPRTREAARNFLKRIGAAGWPSAPGKTNGSSSATEA
jgi:hypothetical protein